MIKDITSIKIGPVWNGGRGATYKEEIEAVADFGPDLKLDEPITAQLMLIRMKNGITVVISDLQTGLAATCARCLDKFSQSIEIASTEAHFYEEPPKKDFDLLEVNFIRTQDMSIDLTEALRQEIILHFPMIPVCSERCRGLCESCRVNLNHSPHSKDCRREKEPEEKPETDQNRPFAHLKDLLNK